MESERTVTISLREYRMLMEVKRDMEFVVELALGSAQLGWNKRDLRFDDDTLAALIQFINPVAYQDRLFELQKEEETVTINACDSDQ